MVSGLFRGVVALVLVSVVVSCGGGDDGGDLNAVGENCAKTPDCESGLACIGQVCQLEGADCPADKDCEGLVCGLDPICGQSCGGCDDGKVCDEGLCIDEACTPDCGGLECGIDPVCGASCGTCGDGKTCQAGECKAGSFPPGAKWISIPGGTFQMGCSPGDDDCDTGEEPVHQVTLSGFEMLETEVTEGQYLAVTGSSPSSDKLGANYPVENINWARAKAFCQAVGGRLPTEAEWEYAARGGTTTPFYCGDDYSCLDGVAWHDDNSDGKKHPVGGKTPNSYGLYDMLGNVWEWTNDWYGDYESAAQTNPQGPESGSEQVFRGGSIDDYYYGYILRVSYRNGHDPLYYGDAYLGFRCARSK